MNVVWCCCGPVPPDRDWIRVCSRCSVTCVFGCWLDTATTTDPNGLGGSGPQRSPVLICVCVCVSLLCLGVRGVCSRKKALPTELSLSRHCHLLSRHCHYLIVVIVVISSLTSFSSSLTLRNVIERLPVDEMSSFTKKSLSCTRLDCLIFPLARCQMLAVLCAKLPTNEVRYQKIVPGSISDGSRSVTGAPDAHTPMFASDKHDGRFFLYRQQ